MILSRSRHFVARFTASRSFGSLSLLEGVKVLDFTRVLAGPYCTQILGDYGAEITKLEKVGAGDDTRNWGPPFVGKTSAYFVCANRNKRSLAIDLRKPEAIEIVKKLVLVSDVVVDNFIPGDMDKLGIGWNQLKEINPRLIHCSISAYGATGPYSHRPGYDVMVSAESGLTGITGEPEGKPVRVGVAITDVLTGVYAHGAITSALYSREKTGKGQFIDCSLFDCQLAGLVNVASSYLNAGQEGRRWGTGHPSIVPYQGFSGSDGMLMIGATNDQQWTHLCQALNIPDSISKHPDFNSNANRVKNRQRVIEVVQTEISKKSVKEWLKILNDFEVPCAPINSLAEAYSDPHALHRGMVAEMTDSTGQLLRSPGIPIKFSETSPTIRLPPPLLGEHTDMILSNLGLSTEEIQDLKLQKIVG